MGRPLSKRYFGSTAAATAQSAQNTTVDGKDQAGHTLTDTALYSEKKLGYSIPVHAARVSNNGTTQTEVQLARHSCERLRHCQSLCYEHYWHC